MDAGVARISSGQLPKGTLLLSSWAPIGYLELTEVAVSINQGIIAMLCDDTLPNHYVLRWAQANTDTIVGNANGTTFLEISKKNFRPIPHRCSNDGTARQFRPASPALAPSGCREAEGVRVTGRDPRCVAPEAALGRNPRWTLGTRRTT